MTCKTPIYIFCAANFFNIKCAFSCGDCTKIVEWRPNKHYVILCDWLRGENVVLPRPQAADQVRRDTRHQDAQQDQAGHHLCFQE